MATEIEAQTVRWIAELIGFAGLPRRSSDLSAEARSAKVEAAEAGGLLVSGGNMANFVCFLAARTARAGWDVRKAGISGSHPRLLVYASAETHTWLQKAADLFGFGTDAIRWIGVDARQRMKTADLRQQSTQTAPRRSTVPRRWNGWSVSTGAVDPLPEIERSAGARSWFHVDGA